MSLLSSISAIYLMESIIANTPFSICRLQVASYINIYAFGGLQIALNDKGQYYHCYTEGDRHNFTNRCKVVVFQQV